MSCGGASQAFVHLIMNHAVQPQKEMEVMTFFYDDPFPPFYQQIASRRQFLIRAGQLGLGLGALPLVLDACAPSSLTPSATPIPSSDLVWELANPYGISFTKSGSTVWHSGHLNAMVELATPGTPLLVGADSGGVWLIEQEGAKATPLSLKWDVPDIKAMALGPKGPLHIYAGGDSGFPAYRGGLYETVTTAANPLQQWKSINPPGINGVTSLALMTNPNRLIVATLDGILWANIPTDASEYQWYLGQGKPGACYSVAVGPNNTIIASIGSAVNNGGVMDPNTLMVGQWQSNPPQLILTPATISGIDSTIIRATALATCATQPNVAYASCSVKDGSLYAVLRSTDGGNHWAPCNTTITNGMGLNLHQVGTQANGYANCVAVSPKDPNTIIVAGIAPCVSRDGGNTWALITQGVYVDTNQIYGDPDGALYVDYHAIVFAPNDPNQVYFCHDGGLSKTTDLNLLLQQFGSQTLVTTYNQHLATLQCYNTSHMTVEWSELGVSTQTDDLIVTGTQDNGNLAAILGNHATPWQRVDNGDGGPTVFLRTGPLLHMAAANEASGVGLATWNGTTFTAVDINGSATPIPTANASPLIPSVIELVNDPTYQTSDGLLIYAIAAQGPHLYGLFNVTDPAKIQWKQLATIPAIDYITALGAGSGKLIFIGTISGTMYVYNVATATFTIGQGIQTDVNANIGRIIVQDEPEAFATFNIVPTTAEPNGHGRVYHTIDGQQWKPLSGGLPDEIFMAMDTDWTRHPKPLFVATPTKVYGSRDNGVTWHLQAQGLPKQPHCGDLRFVFTSSQERYLYLSTYGWSVWRTQVP